MEKESWQVSLGTTEHSSLGVSLGTSLVVNLQVFWGLRSHNSSGTSITEDMTWARKLYCRVMQGYQGRQGIRRHPWNAKGSQRKPNEAKRKPNHAKVRRKKGSNLFW